MKNKLNPFHGNTLLLICAILFILIGSRVQSMDLMKGLLITEFILIMLPALIFAFILKVNIKEEFRFNKFTFKEIVLVTVIVVTMYPVAVFVNYVAATLLSTIGELQINPIDEVIDRGFVVSMLVIAGSAGLCEEILFRGFIMRSYDRIGQWKAILFSGLFFGMFHFNLQNLLGPILLGIVIGYIVIRTNSLWMGIYAHMLNNAIAVVLTRIVMLVPDTGEVIEPITLEMMIMSGITLLIIASFFGTLSFLSLRRLKKVTEGKNSKVMEVEVSDDSHELTADTLSEQYHINSHAGEVIPMKRSISYFSLVPIIIFVLIFLGMSSLQIIVIRNPEIFLIFKL